jgi:hypothetical protein
MIKNKIIELLEQYNIPYIKSGKNVGKKAIAGVNCPFCGDDDGYHVGILQYKNYYYYKCWKNSSHKGSLNKLFSILLSKSIDECKNLLTLDVNNVIIYTENEIEEKKLGGVKSLEFLPEFKLISNTGIYSTFKDYLKRRGFSNVNETINRFKLMGCLSGPWAYRLIIPIYFNHKLVSWSGRSINGNPLRYRDLSINDSVRHVKYNLFDYDYINNNLTNKLYICEGQFDAMKLSLYSRNNATCIFTTSIREEQISLLYKISGKYKELILVLDKNAEIQSMLLMKQLSFIKNLKFLYLPVGIKDTGALTQEQIMQLNY